MMFSDFFFFYCLKNLCVLNQTFKKMIHMQHNYLRWSTEGGSGGERGTGVLSELGEVCLPYQCQGFSPL